MFCVSYSTFHRALKPKLRLRLGLGLYSCWPVRIQILRHIDSNSMFTLYLGFFFHVRELNAALSKYWNVARGLNPVSQKKWKCKTRGLVVAMETAFVMPIDTQLP